ncbi:MAG: hypothetical protein KAR20_26450, partial [Candidatus Heimdallarchaeota archaeon]|nr:hypothetical protein [Candidatus Heimdallarchaeota archaeon]
MKPIVFILFLSTFISAQDGWFWQNPRPQGNNLNDIHLFDDNSSIAVGDFGTIINIRNKGNSLNITHNTSGSGANLHSVFFINPNTGWAVGTSYFNYTHNSVVLKTVDAGKNWHLCYEDSQYVFNDIFFIDSSVGYMACQTIVWWGFGGSALVFKTIDGGSSWNLLPESIVDGWYNSLYFLNADTGWVVGGYGDDVDFNGWISKTMDGGQAWTKNQNGLRFFESVFFPSFDKGWIVGGDRCLYTTDHGNNWQDFVLSDVHNLNEVYFYDKNHGWILDQKWYSNIPHVEIWRTINAGSSWLKLPVDSAIHISSVDFIDTEYGWGVGPGGSIYYT